MKLTMTYTALAALIAGTAPAMAECNIGKTTQYTQQDDAVMAGARRDLRQLRNAAMILETYGKEDACQNVVSAIQEIRDNRGAAQVGAKPASGEAQTAADRQSIDYQQVMAQAKPVSDLESGLTVDRMMDADVRGAKGEVVGEISDIVLSSEGKPSYAIVAFGGFLGVGEDRVAIPFEKLKMQSKVNDNDDLMFFVSMTEKQLQNAPRIKENDNSWLSNDDWTSKNDEYYESNNVES